MSIMKIQKEILGQIIKQAHTEAPLECCGYLAGTEREVTKAYPMENIDKSEEHYSFLPEDQFRVVKGIRQERLIILAAYHSHPESPARPSAEDIKPAWDPDVCHVIISLQDVEEVVKSFRIKDGQVQEEELKTL